MQVHRNILKYAYDMKTMKILGHSISDHTLLLCKVGYVDRRKEEVNNARRIKSEKLRRQKYKERYGRAPVMIIKCGNGSSRQ